MKTDIVIVGGGLAGVALAGQLESAKKDWLLVESTSALGGRISSPSISAQQFDVGPAWFWPGQPRIARLIKKYNLTVFEQYSNGAQVFEDGQGNVHANQSFSSMQGSLRIAGGMKQLIDSLHQDIPNQKIHLGQRVTKLIYNNERIAVHFGDKIVSAKHVVLALPPRIAVSNVQFSPSLSSCEISRLQEISTWMAGQAKILAVYDKPYWRNKGFSGDAMSRKGPMVEIHDASPVEGGPYALFGFVGIPPHVRAPYKDELISIARQQLVNMFGGELGHPIDIRLVDWAQNKNVATALDQQNLRGHPIYGYPVELKALWNGQLHLGSTEIASSYGGFLEGALEASEQVFERIRKYNSLKKIQSDSSDHISSPIQLFSEASSIDGLSV